VNTGPNRGIKKRCPACEREFVGTLVVCAHDGTLLVPVKETLVGQVLANKYEVLEEIGRGGMSVVYKGRHAVMDRTVAIKMLQSQLVTDQNSLLRFQREAQAVACLAHPNIISVYEYEIHDGQPYLVMDYLVGESLADIIKRENHISTQRLVKIFIRVTDALEHAHHKGVLHRDLKSSNVMLVNTEGGEVVKVVDFGIAKILPSSGKQAQNLTATGEIFGSPIYMSPEQCQGLPLDNRSDIYSTGVMLYEALSGEPPLLGENIVDTMQMHVTTAPQQFIEIRPDLYIPDGLEAIVKKALEKNPDQRFHSMLEFKEALEYFEKNAGAEGQRSTNAGVRPVAGSTRSTRQGMTGSRAPGSMPKPVLDDRAPSNRHSTSEQRASSTRNSRADQRASSARNSRADQRATSGIPDPRLARKEEAVSKYKIGDLEEFDESAKNRKILLTVSIIFIIIAVIGLGVWVVMQISRSNPH